MIYEVLRPIFRLSFLAYYKHIYIHNAYNYPKDKPILFAGNHPNAILDGIINCCVNNEKSVYMVSRGDVFLKPTMNKILRRLHLMPIFRVQDGKELLYRNQATFDECVEILGRNDCVNIYPEAVCVYEKRLRKLKNGTAKIAIQAYLQGIDLYIVCVGMNYTYAKEYRSEVMIGYSNAVRVADYADLIAENEAKAVVAITKKMEEDLSKTVIHIQNPADEPLCEQLFVMARNNFVRPILPHTIADQPERLRTEYHIAQLVSNAPPPQLAPTTQAYHALLSQFNLQDSGVAEAKKTNFLQKMALLLSTPIMVAAYALCMPPFLLAKRLTEKSPVKNAIEFYASVNWPVGMICFALYMLLFSTAIGGVFGFKVGIISFFLLPMLGFLAQNWLEATQTAYEQFKFSRLSKENQTKLQLHRKNIFEMLTL